MDDKVKRLTEEVKAHLQAAQQVAAAADDAGRDFTDEERSQVQERMGKAQEAKQQLNDAKADADVRTAIRDLGDSVGLVDSEAEAQKRRDQADSGGYVHTPSGIGETFISSQQYAELLKSAPNGQFGKDMRVQSRPVGYKDLVTRVDPASGGAFGEQTDYRGVLVGPEQFYRPLTLRSLVTAGTTDTDQIEYSRITGWTNNAAPVPEATSAEPVGSGTTPVTEAQGGVKPQSGFTATRVTTPVRTIAHWMPITKRALSDAAQVRTLIDNFLQVGLEEELEDQMIAGDGTGENFEGLSTVSGTQAQDLVADPAGKPEGFGKLLTLRRAKTKVRTVGRSVANGYVIHPSDWESIEELSDNDGRFYGDGPFGAGRPGSLWGLPVIESEAQTPGVAWAGDFRKAILWNRQQASITVTDSHADFFVRNLVAILAEMRAGFGVIQPSAFVRVSLATAAG